MPVILHPPQAASFTRPASNSASNDKPPARDPSSQVSFDAAGELRQLPVETLLAFAQEPLGSVHDARGRRCAGVRAG